MQSVRCRKDLCSHEFRPNHSMDRHATFILSMTSFANLPGLEDRILGGCANHLSRIQSARLCRPTLTIDISKMEGRANNSLVGLRRTARCALLSTWRKSITQHYFYRFSIVALVNIFVQSNVVLRWSSLFRECSKMPRLFASPGLPSRFARVWLELQGSGARGWDLRRNQDADDLWS